jgi:hypothetical protein
MNSRRACQLTLRTVGRGERLGNSGGINHCADHQYVGAEPALRTLVVPLETSGGVVGCFSLPRSAHILYSARKLIHGLAADVNTSLNDPSGRRICRTEISRGCASAAKPVFRKTAETPLQQFLERLDTVNSSPDYVYRVEARYSSAACSLKPSGWEMWKSPSNCCRRSPRRRSFGSAVTGADWPIR